MKPGAVGIPKWCRHRCAGNCDAISSVNWRNELSLEPALGSDPSMVRMPSDRGDSRQKERHGAGRAHVCEAVGRMRRCCAPAGMHLAQRLRGIGMLGATPLRTLDATADLVWRHLENEENQRNAAPDRKVDDVLPGNFLVRCTVAKAVRHHKRRTGWPRPHR
jgi:hypothetical protein